MSTPHPEERQVVCRDCNGYLYAEESTDGQTYRLTACPYKCDSAGNMEVPPNTQPYGRS
jgi:hypothetical protein